MSPVTVRPYQPADRDDVRRICCDTAFYGDPIERVFADRAFVADALMNYYTDFEPGSLFVAEVDGRVVGYCAGCLDTQRYFRVYASCLVPRLCWLFLAHGHAFRLRLWRLIFSTMASGRPIAAGRRTILESYPSHCHVNIQPGLQRGGIGSALLRTCLESLRQRGAKGIHVSTATEQGKSFFAKAGLQTVARYPTPRLPIESPSEVWVMGKRLD